MSAWLPYLPAALAVTVAAVPVIRRALDSSDLVDVYEEDDPCR